MRMRIMPTNSFGCCALALQTMTMIRTGDLQFRQLSIDPPYNGSIVKMANIWNDFSISSHKLVQRKHLFNIEKPKIILAILRFNHIKPQTSTKKRPFWYRQTLRPQIHSTKAVIIYRITSSKFGSSFHTWQDVYKLSLGDQRHIWKTN